MTGDPTLWILARSTGVVAYALLSGTVLAGLMTKSRPVKALAPAATVDVHRFLSLLALMAVGLHGVFLALDTSVRIPVLALLAARHLALPPALGRSRRGRRRADAAGPPLVPVPQADRAPKNWRRLH